YHSHKVCIHQILDLLKRHIVHIIENTITCIVDQNIDGSMLVNRLFYRFSDRGSVPHVQYKGGKRISAFLRQRSQLILGTSHRHDSRALIGESASGYSANSAGRSGDQDNLARNRPSHVNSTPHTRYENSILELSPKINEYESVFGLRSTASYCYRPRESSVTELSNDFHIYVTTL